jgi:NAD+ kinase
MKPAVLIVGDRRKQGVLEGVARHRDFLERHLAVRAWDLDESVDLATARVDLVLVFGGDGSILHVARRLGTNPVPVLGVNFGHFGFLADLEPEEIEQGVRRWLDGDAVVSARHRLQVRVLASGREIARTLAFNDVVVGRRVLGGMVDVDVAIGGRRAVTYSGDGLIVATATGSTAHALAAGGPMVEPTANALVLVPMAPHTLSARPLVVPGTEPIQLSMGGRRGAGDVTVDGLVPSALERDHVVDIRDAGAPLKLVHVSGRSFYDLLRVKLGWRGRPSYARDPDGEQEDARP